MEIDFEPWTTLDQALQKQLDEVQERMGRQLGQLEGMVQLKAAKPKPKLTNAPMQI